MGGQACVLYGGAEFSRDIDLAIESSEENLEFVREALARLSAERVFAPELTREALDRGHACHFRARAEGTGGIRIDLMSRMRGCDDFTLLWERRSIMETESGEFPLLGLPDLIRAKKTQRDKDWPMIRRLVEADIVAAGPEPDSARIDFWLLECRTPSILIELAGTHREACSRRSEIRPLLEAALRGDEEALARGLAEEEAVERRIDAAHWLPLKRELEAMRHDLSRKRAFRS